MIDRVAEVERWYTKQIALFRPLFVNARCRVDVGGVTLVGAQCADGSAGEERVTIQRPDGCTVLVRSPSRMMGFWADTDTNGLSLWAQITLAATHARRGTHMVDMAASFFRDYDYVTERNAPLYLSVPRPSVVWADAALEHLRMLLGEER